MPAFHLTTKSGLNFCKLFSCGEWKSIFCFLISVEDPVVNGTAFSVFYFLWKRTTLQGLPKFSKISSRKCLFHSILLLEFLNFWLSDPHFRNSTAPKIFKKLSQEISVPISVSF